jgi:hypothetical protein
MKLLFIWAAIFSASGLKADLISDLRLPKDGPHQAVINFVQSWKFEDKLGHIRPYASQRATLKEAMDGGLPAAIGAVILEMYTFGPKELESIENPSEGNICSIGVKAQKAAFGITGPVPDIRSRPFVATYWVIYEGGEWRVDVDATVQYRVTNWKSFNLRRSTSPVQTREWICLEPKGKFTPDFESKKFLEVRFENQPDLNFYVSKDASFYSDLVNQLDDGKHHSWLLWVNFPKKPTDAGTEVEISDARNGWVLPSSFYPAPEKINIDTPTAAKEESQTKDE